MQQQRQPRLGDTLDDYCPRERRITNHAVVAMIEDRIKLTRCTTCDAEHDYKEAKVPSSRRRKDPTSALYREVLASVAPDAEAPPDQPAEPVSASEGADVDEPAAESSEDGGATEPAAAPEEGPVHRPLIRATLPRIEGQAPERRLPEFTFRQNGGRNGNFRVFDQRGAGGGGQPRRPQGGSGGRFASGGRPAGGSRGGQRPPMGGGGQPRRGGPGGPGRGGKKRSR